MAKPPPQREATWEIALMRALEGFFDPDWYLAHYPDVAGSLDPLLHFVRHGLIERRDPNRFFDGAWYTEHYPDVSVSGLHPLLHYLQTGAAALRNPHPRFDARWYVEQHPDAAGNPLLYHIRVGLAHGHPTEKPIEISDYLPSERTPSRLPRKVVVDVVIPVYRGLEETQRCIASVLADPGKPLGRIIVVDDRSPEPALSAWLRNLAARDEIVLVRNKRNLGFVASVNRGMEAAGAHDVVLLNSDTEVPRGWLARLAARAYAEPRIATVSPFSNNATICGYPDNTGGPIAFGHGLAELDDICRTVNAGRAVDVPTTVGFCMYIRREALREVGAFDADRFTVGYGEENDFCLRATGLGWRHRLACDTFVYHKGSVSFGDRANTLSERAMQLILERYPDYLRDVARHVSTGDVVPSRFAVTAALFRRSKLPVILMVAHDLGGGVRRHIDRLVERFGDQARFLLLEATDRGAALSVPSLPHHAALILPADRIDDLVLMLRSMAVSRVHIHHLLGMDMDVHDLIRRLDVPFDVTVHDYYGICPQINLLPWRHGLYCGEPDIAGCNACIAHRSSHGARDIVSWRAEQAWQFKDAARVFCPSQDALARLERYGLAANAVLAPHEPVTAGPWPLRVRPPGNGPLRIAVLGTLVDHKGGRTVASVAELADPKRFEIHLIGHTDGAFSPTALQRMKLTGRYEEAKLDALIETVAPHLIWFPAAWPETFSYTLSAAIDAGIPIAATRIGSHEERLAGRPFTWLAGVATAPAGWIAMFEAIRTTLSGHTMSGEATSGRTTFGKTASGKAASRAAVANRTVVSRSVPGGTGPQETVSDRTVSGRTASGGIVSGRSVSDKSVSENIVSGKTASGETPRRPAVDDFYGTHYLRPTNRPRPTGVVGPAGVVHPAGAGTASKPRIAVVPERFGIGFPTPCGYIRLLQPLHHPAIARGFDVRVTSAETMLRQDAEIIVTQRFAMRDMREADRLAAHARAIGATLVFDLDDDLLAIPRNHPDARVLRPRAAVVRRMLDLADVVWLSTPGLAERLGSIRPDAMVMENGLDERIWTPPALPPHDQPVRILCMGTTTHDSDFALIEPALVRIKAEYRERVVIDIIGMTARSDVPAGLNRIGPPVTARRSYPGFVHWLASAEPQWHIGLAPLLDTPFNRCKSPIKAMDYAAMGLTVLASDTPVYQGSLADGPAGQLVANTPAAWYAALNWRLRDREALQAAAARSREAFLTRASLASQAEVRRGAWSRLRNVRKTDAAA